MKLSSLTNVYDLDRDYPDMWTIVEHAEICSSQNLYLSRREDEIWRAMHELWLARANAPKKA